eukprot:m.34185 g.34185  ORF g.34185 m.34185 type:complete len:164 (+) comp5111_c0_seq1:578-1069(+)
MGAHPAYIALLWVQAMGVGLMSGVYFCFSVFVMQSLAELDDVAGAQAMQSINRVIVKTLFLPIFFLSSLLCIPSIVVGALRITEKDGTYALVAGVVYLVGMFLCTVFFNVPLNNGLDEVDATSLQGAVVWKRYLVVWTRYNHVRTVSCTAALGLYIAAIVGAM